MHILEAHGATVYLLPIPEGEKGSHRLREQETVATIIGCMFGEDAVLHHNDHGAPFITGSLVPPGAHFSISHCAHTAAVAYHLKKAIGVDLEVWREQLRKVAHRFLSERELSIFASDDGLLRAWTAKEAAFKAAEVPDLMLADISLNDDASTATILRASNRNFHVYHYQIIENGYLAIAMPYA